MKVNYNIHGSRILSAVTAFKLAKVDVNLWHIFTQSIDNRACKMGHDTWRDSARLELIGDWTHLCVVVSISTS